MENLETTSYSCMTHNNIVTALIPTYQRPTWLARSIKSVLNQTYPHVLISVFDNASDDNTQQVVAALCEKDHRILYHRHTTNIGPLKNFKHAFQSIKTPYFSILSDDDALAFDFYHSAVTILDNNPDIMFVILNTLTIDSHANLIGHQPCDHALTFYRGNNRLNVPNLPSTWTSILFRKEVANVYLEMNDKFDIASDMRFLLLASARYPFAYLSKIGAFFTQHNHSTSAGRKRFDIVHHAVQISRYIEVFYDPNIDPYFKNVASNCIRSMIYPSKKQSLNTFFETLKLGIKEICRNPSDITDECDSEIREARQAGFPIAALFLKLMYQNILIRQFIRILFSSYYKNLQLKQKKYLRHLQQTIYKNIFDTLKEISV